MSQYLVMCGQLHLDRATFETAQREQLRLKTTAYSDTGEESESLYAPTVEEFFSVPDFDDSEDEWFVELNKRWTLNEFDAKSGTWRFSVPLHESFWADLNDRDQLPRHLLTVLARSKGGPLADPLLLFWDVAKQVNQAFVLTSEGWNELPLKELPAGPIKEIVSGKVSSGLASIGTALNREKTERVEQRSAPRKPAKAKP